MWNVILSGICGRAKLSKAASSNRSGAFENSDLRTFRMDISLYIHDVSKHLRSFCSYLYTFVRRSFCVFFSIDAYEQHGKDYTDDYQKHLDLCCKFRRLFFAWM